MYVTIPDPAQGPPSSVRLPINQSLSTHRQEAARIEEDLKKRQFLKELETMRRRGSSRLVSPLFFGSSVFVRLFNCNASFTENENNKKALAAIRAQIEADKRERAQKAVQEKALRDGKATARGPATATITATASTAAPVTSSLPGREFPETRLQIRLASVGVPITTTLRSDASCVPLLFPYEFAFSDRPSSVFLALWEVAEFIAGRVLSLDANTVTISQFQHFPRCVFSPPPSPSSYNILSNYGPLMPILDPQRKAFLPSDFSRTLRDIGLTPSAVCRTLFLSEVCGLT